MAKKKEATPVKDEPVKEKHTIRVKLTNEDRLKILDHLHELYVKVEDLKEEKRSYNKDINEQIKELNADLFRQNEKIETGTKPQVVEAMRVKDYDKGMIVWMVDGKEVDTRKMTQDDYQVQIKESVIETATNGKAN